MHTSQRCDAKPTETKDLYGVTKKSKTSRSRHRHTLHWSDHNLNVVPQFGTLIKRN